MGGCECEIDESAQKPNLLRKSVEVRKVGDFKRDYAAVYVAYYAGEWVVDGRRERWSNLVAEARTRQLNKDWLEQ